MAANKDREAKEDANRKGIKPKKVKLHLRHKTSSNHRVTNGLDPKQGTVYLFSSAGGGGGSAALISVCRVRGKYAARITIPYVTAVVALFCDQTGTSSYAKGK